MKTHDIAKALSVLSKLLRSLPNQELDRLHEAVAPHQGNSLGVSLSVLASLSKYSKSDWESVVKDFDIPVDIRPRDAARDVMGKILTYLADNDAERARVAERSRVQAGGSSELSSALRFLLSNG